jgi:hypothetical protein
LLFLFLLSNFVGLFCRVVYNLYVFDSRKHIDGVTNGAKLMNKTREYILTDNHLIVTSTNLKGVITSCTYMSGHQTQENEVDFQLF